MARRGHREPWDADPIKWPTSATCECLGHVLADDVPAWPCWERTCGKRCRPSGQIAAITSCDHYRWSEA
eukprot:499195-Alexandrium_andersonii.AAC.1